MEELRSLRGQPSADHHDQTKLYDGSGASDRSDPPGPADRKQRKSFRNAFCLCVTMIPTGIALLYQFSGIFTGTNAMGEETGIAIGFAKVWSNYCKSIPLSIIMGMALPIGVLFLNLVFDFKNIKSNRYYWFAWLNYLMGTVMFLIFYEKDSA